MSMAAKKLYSPTAVSAVNAFERMDDLFSNSSAITPVLGRVSRILTTTLLWIFALLAPGFNLFAQAYPIKPVKIVVSYPVGTAGDFAARTYSPKLSEGFGQQFVVDNRVGGAGIIGAESVARAAPDGYTLLTTTISMAIQQTLSKNLTYDIEKDFEQIALLASTPYVIAVHPSVPAKNIEELIAIARAKPGFYTYGSGGSGSGSHLATELLKMQARIDLLHVPYKGSSQAATDLLAGQISLLFASQTLQYVRTGRLRALAMTSEHRSTLAPDIVTVAESGLPGFDAGSWSGLAAPRGTPRDIIVRLNAAINKIAGTAEARKILSSQSAAEPRPGTVEQASAYMSSEIAKWKKVIISAKVTGE